MLDDVLRDLEKHGESWAKGKLAAHAWSDPAVVAFVSSWLEERSAAADARREAREEETLSISRDANSIARKALEQAKWANRLAIAATIIAIIAMFIAKS